MPAADTTQRPKHALSEFLHGAGQVFGRSLFPFTALAIILGTMLWGPLVSLILAIAWWKIVTRIG